MVAENTHSALTEFAVEAIGVGTICFRYRGRRLQVTQGAEMVSAVVLRLRSGFSRPVCQQVTVGSLQASQQILPIWLKECNLGENLALGSQLSF